MGPTKPIKKPASAPIKPPLMTQFERSFERLAVSFQMTMPTIITVEMEST